MNPLFEILHEDADLLVVNKPAGLVCHPTKGDDTSSLIGRLRLHLGPGLQPRLVNRLDRETSGVTVVARTPEAARELGRLWERRAVTKDYLAIIHGHLASDELLVDAPLGKDIGSRVAIKDCVRADGAPAQTQVRVLRRFTRDGRPFTLAAVQPRSGRKHQIRIHLSHAGHPIVGDKIYSEDERLYLDFVAGRLTAEQQTGLLLPHHALHAAELRVPWRGREWRFQAKPEEWFEAFAAVPSLSPPVGHVNNL